MLLLDALQNRLSLSDWGHNLGYWLTLKRGLSKQMGKTFKKNVFTGHDALPGSCSARQLAAGIPQAQLSSSFLLQNPLCFSLDAKCLWTRIPVFKQTPHMIRSLHSGVMSSQAEERGWTVLPAAKCLGASDHLTHIDQEGRASMVDVGKKSDSERTAVASAVIHLGEKAFELVRQNQIKKGDVLAVAQIAGIQGAKLTSQLIPLCHNIPLNLVDVDLSLDQRRYAVVIRARCRSHGKTGVEMEALTAASLAALTVYDMCKSVTRDMVIEEVKLLSKEGGQRGDFHRN